jgi:hypothetical protein
MFVLAQLLGAFGALALSRVIFASPRRDLPATRSEVLHEVSDPGISGSE